MAWRLLRFHLYLVALAIFPIGAGALAQTWTGNSSNAWSNPSNWSGGLPSNNGTANVVFTQGSASLDANWNIGTLNLSGRGSILSGSNTLTIQSGLTSSIVQTGTPEIPLGVNINLAGVQTWNITTSDLPVTGIISGTGGITKTGSGQLTLNSGNTYSGGTIVTAGSIWPTDDTSFGDLNGQLQLNGGTLLFETESYSDNSILNFSRNITVGGSGAALSIKRNLNLSSSITGSGSLTIARNSSTPYIAINPAVTLSGSSSFTGGLIITNPLYTMFSSDTWSVTVSGTNQSLGNGPVTLSAGSSLSVNSQSNLGTGKKITIVGNSALIVANDSLDPATLISSSSSQGYLEIGGSTYSQSLNFGILGDGTLSLGVADGQTVVYAASTLQPGAGNVYRLGGNMNQTATQLVISGHDNVLTGSASLQTSGVVSLMNANNFTGGTTVNGRTGVGNNGALGSGPIYLNGGILASVNGTISLSNPIVILSNSTLQGPLTLTGTVNLNGGAPPLFVNGGSPVTFTNVISNGTLNLNSGKVILQAANTLSTLDLYGGTAAISTESNLGGYSTPIIFSNGGVLETSSNIILNNPIAYYSFSNSNTAAFKPDSGTTLTLTESISGGTVNVMGTGNLAFSTSSSLTDDALLNIKAGLVTSSGNSLANCYVTVYTSGAFAGSGNVGWLVSGGGQVTPGGGPGTVVASLMSVSTYNGPSTFQFLFTQLGSPNYSNLTNSGNGLISFSGLTSGSNQNFSGNNISIYLATPTVQLTNTFRGAFFVQSTTSVSPSLLTGANFSFYVLSPTGTTTFNGQTFSPLDSSLYAVKQNWMADNGGQVCQFQIVNSLGSPPSYASLNTPYSFAFSTSGNPTYSVTSGSLPPGITLSSTGVLSGSPTAAGVYNFAITSTDSLGINTIQNFTFNTQLQNSTDTPAMPVWALILLGLTLVRIAVRSVPIDRLQ